MLAREGGEVSDTDAKLGAVTSAAAQIPQYDFLNVVLNQTGRIDEVVAAAEVVEAAVARGEIDRSGTLDKAWLVAYRALYDAWDDKAELQNTFRSFDLASERGQPPGKTMEILDRIIAVDALTPYLRGEAAEPPAVPEIASPELADQWPLWLEVAAKIKADPNDPTLGAETTLRIAAELLLAAGDVDALVALTGSAPASLGTMRLADDMSIRLDRQCEGFLAHRSEALLLSGTPIYKFDGRDNR
jgi:hypothetical protein